MQQASIVLYFLQRKKCIYLKLLLASIIILYGQMPIQKVSAHNTQTQTAQTKPVQIQIPSLNGSKNILYISAFTSSYTWDVEIIYAVRKTLKNAGIEVQFYEEFLNLRSIGDKEKVFDILSTLYAEKYKNIKFDLIIANEEIDFMLTHGKKIFADVPILFCSLENNTYESIKNTKNMSATIDVRKPEKVLEFLFLTHPDVENIFVIMDNSLGSRVVIPKIQAISRKHHNVLFSYVKPANKNELGSFLMNLPSSTVLLDTSYFSSPPTNALLHEQRKAMAYELTNLPLFTIWNKAVGFGAIAGQEVSAKAHGDSLGKLAVEILQKGNAFDVSPIFIGNSPLLVDYAMLQHFNISEDFIPSEAILLNKPKTFYKKHRDSLLLLASFVGLSLICIFFLLVALQQKRVEKRILLATLENQKKEQKMQGQRLHLETMETLAAFSSGITHDINGVLQVIFACSELIEEELDTDSTLYQDVKKIQEMSQRGQGILNKIMLQSTQDSSQKNTILAKELEILLPLLHSILPNGCQLHYENMFPEATVSLHQDEIYQLFYNLSTNAMQAMVPKGGELSIYITRAEASKASHQKNIDIRVQDTGHGISAEYLESIFKPYFTTKKEQGHFGLGLFSLQSMIAAHYGSITVKSQQGHTVFHIQLPCV